MPRAPSVRGLRIGLCQTPLWKEATPEAQAVLHAAGAALVRAGAVVAPVVLPPAFACINAQHNVLMEGEGGTGFKALTASRGMLLADDFRAQAENRKGFTPQQLRAAHDYLAARRVEFEALFEEIDALMMLAVPGEAPHGLHTQGMATFNRMGTALHVPCIAIPGWRGAKGLPIGVQIKRPRFDDDRLLAIAAAIGPVLERAGK